MWIWDYNIKKNWQPQTAKQWEWFLVRKINYGDFQGLHKETVAKFFDKIKEMLDPGKREMLKYFLNQRKSPSRTLKITFNKAQLSS